jgi:hypothetical protein
LRRGHLRPQRFLRLFGETIEVHLRFLLAKIAEGARHFLASVRRTIKTQQSAHRDRMLGGREPMNKKIVDSLAQLLRQEFPQS